MIQIFRKLKLLPSFLTGAFNTWHTEVWKRDLDALYCCNGRECGCGGCTVGEIFGESP